MISCRPVSPSLAAESVAGKLSAWQAKIPDVLRFKNQCEPAVAILSRCVNDLRSASPESRKAARVTQGDARPGPRRIQWHGKGDTIKVGQYRLADPLVYACDETPREAEASCIILSLPVGKPLWEAVGRMAAYPTYAGLTPGQRANYLRWLSSGRAGPLHEINYAIPVLLWSRAALILDRADQGPIVNEAVRLLETYKFSGALDNYLSHFLAYALARAGLDTNDESAALVFEKSRIRLDEDPLAVALAWFFNRNAALPASWAFKIARQDPRLVGECRTGPHSRGVPYSLRGRYHERFGDGMPLKAAKRDRFVAYRPVSPSPCFNVDRSDLATKPVKIPHVLGIEEPVRPSRKHLV